MTPHSTNVNSSLTIIIIVFFLIFEIYDLYDFELDFIFSLF
jgi:hypothetical protein